MLSLGFELSGLLAEKRLHFLTFLILTRTRKLSHFLFMDRQGVFTWNWTNCPTSLQTYQEPISRHIRLIRGVKRCNCWVNYCHSKFVAACRCLLTICDVFGHKLFKVENSREFANCIWEELSRGVVEEQILPAGCQRHQNWGCKLEEERSLDWLSVFYIRVACHWFFTSFPSMPCYIMNLLLLNNTNLPF